ncbi:MAG TPA: hypothetical protein VNG90_01245 [Candidatus Acidoferrum sp.]|nr:hypothetical protein [Candidatus Acidoferrum sp.]
MRKDVIYIDVEDDVTSVISKVKAAQSDVVALVPPKRAGTLQSAVNLKLLQKAAAEAGKRIVLVTSDNLLTSLAAGIKIPVAKNLQSRPEIPTLSSLAAPQAEDADDTINGEALPVGDFAGSAASAETANAAPTPSAAEAIAERVDFGEKSQESLPQMEEPKPAAKSFGKLGKVGVPDFNKFRKRLFIGGGVVIVVAGLLYWALAIAPRAAITIQASTSPVGINRTLSLQPSLSASNVANLQFKPTQQQLKDAESVSFTATGSKDIGQNATGTMTIRNCDYGGDGLDLPKGTVFTASDGSGLKFTSTADVSVPAFSGPSSTCTLGGSMSGKATVDVQAADIGSNYNLAAQGYSTQVIGRIDAVGSDMTGGSKQTVAVVSQDDVTKAQALLTQQISQKADASKTKLMGQFGADQLVIDESLASSADTPTANPAVGQQATQATLTVNTTYTMLGLARSDIAQLLANSLKDPVAAKPNQAVFDDGSNGIHFQSFQQLSDNSYSVILLTTGHIGPKIDSQQIAQQIKGKVYGDALQIINDIPGAGKVEVKLSPFWVTSVPSDLHKVSIKFTVTSGGN